MWTFLEKSICLVVWNIFYFSIWESWSQLTFIFFRGVGLNHQAALKKTGSTWIQPLSGDPWWPHWQDLGIDGKIEAGLDGESFDCEMEELRPKTAGWTTRNGKHTKNYGKLPFSMGKSTISMVMFNSYVKLPEGTRNAPSVGTTFETILDKKKSSRNGQFSMVKWAEYEANCWNSCFTWETGIYTDWCLKTIASKMCIAEGSAPQALAWIERAATPRAMARW